MSELVSELVFGVWLAMLIVAWVGFRAANNRMRAAADLEARAVVAASHAVAMAELYAEALALARYGAIEESIDLFDRIRRYEVPP